MAVGRQVTGLNNNKEESKTAMLEVEPKKKKTSRSRTSNPSKSNKSAKSTK